MSVLRLILAAAAVTASGSASAAVVVDDTTIGAPIIVATTGDVTATFDGYRSMYANQLSLAGYGLIFTDGVSAMGSTVDLGTFAAGTELVFSLSVPGTGQTYYSGAASRNSDGIGHAAAQASGNVTSVGFEDQAKAYSDFDYNDLTFHVSNTTSTPALPEPSSWALLVGGFGLIGALARRSGQRALSAI